MFGWWFGPSYLLGQVNFGIDAAAILGILLAAGGGGFYALRSLRPELSREYDVVVAAFSLLCGLILIFKGWELNQIHEFNQFLLTGVAVFLAYENIKMRAATVEQAKRSAPTVDRKRRTSRVYRAEIDELEPRYYDDDAPRVSTRRRLKGTAVARPSRDAYDERDDYRDDDRRDWDDDDRRSWDDGARRTPTSDRDDDRRARRNRDVEDDYIDRRSERRREVDAWDDSDFDDEPRYERGPRSYGRDERVRRETTRRPERREERGERDDWRDSDDPVEMRSGRSERDWRDREMDPEPPTRYERRDDRRGGDDDWDTPETVEREERREERPPMPRMDRQTRRPRPTDSEERTERPSTPTSAPRNASAPDDYADYEPLDDDYELGDSEY